MHPQHFTTENDDDYSFDSDEVCIYTVSPGLSLLSTKYLLELWSEGENREEILRPLWILIDFTGRWITSHTPPSDQY